MREGAGTPRRQRSRVRRVAGAAALACAGALALHCGARTGLFVGDGGLEPSADGGDERNAWPWDGFDWDGFAWDGPFPDAPFVQLCADTGVDASPIDAAAGDAGCDNLECRIVSCGGTLTTRIAGRVFDPAGKLPIYDALVYIPNRPLSPMPAGVTCSACQAPATGRPIRTAVTDATGTFTLVDVPAGPNVPLVMQLGKWRRSITIPYVAPCADTSLFDPAAMRLPAKSSEGDMPLIALTTGCDPGECFLRHVGIDDSEFVPPGGSGHVHVFTGLGGGSAIVGGNSPAQTYAWWGNPYNLLAYDIVLNACECSPYDRGPTAYRAMQGYLDAGGRVFATHYHYNWFVSPESSAEFRSVVDWQPGAAYFTFDGAFFANTSFPKGHAYGDWLLGNGVGSNVTQMGAPGYTAQLVLQDTRNDINQSGPPNHPDSSKWIFETSTTADDPEYASMYVSFNTPTGVRHGQQCGRAVFSDVHLSGQSDGRAFDSTTLSGHCNAADPGGSHRVNETALEFLFFDLSSCVQDDTQPPEQPCAQ